MAKLNLHWVGNESLGYVMIGMKDDGKEETTCMTHCQLESSVPSWGLTNDRSELKQ